MLTAPNEHPTDGKVDTCTFPEEVLNSPLPVVAAFSGEHCLPCDAIAFSLKQIATELAGKLKVVKIDVDENLDLAARYGVRGVPTLLMFKGGEVADIYVGTGSLRSWISKALA
ncbi:thiol reductase thioredoxin [Sinorhizobium medicae]|uniref:thioredoxin family protein n=1 Tax=Sinorhizobium medicae TaxID=110321 RepID=UPI00037706C1|nr:thioredoxin domain-containing protein [Sinorhizobium medicae]MDX0623767.1 thiol reductase thioredoxin [Sinorhizobium medicae]MDX0665979.1 thiol reductase thioredoxin [Sinorhizobium medicae]MDX0740670.1 thiol reductase thioredoxin [Sinorhizobium medicae]UFX03411.1 thiol reductase thioredoxin [Sinorhizobium medicae WSM1115]